MRVYYIIVFLLMSLLVFVFVSLLYSTFIIIFVDFIILTLLYLLSFPLLNLVPIVLIAFLMDINIDITLTTVMNWFLSRMFFKRNTAVVKFLFSRGNVKNHSSIREDDVHVETNNIECSQLNTLSYNNLLSLSKLHHHSSSTSFSYAVSSFNSLYKPITFFFR